jgi:hypothetical protein
MSEKILIWGVDQPVVGNVYKFPEVIEVASVPLSEKRNRSEALTSKPNITPSVRPFKSGRVLSFDEINKTVKFSGYKAKASKNRDRKYEFILSLPN